MPDQRVTIHKDALAPPSRDSETISKQLLAAGATQAGRICGRRRARRGRPAFMDTMGDVEASQNALLASASTDEGTGGGASTQVPPAPPEGLHQCLRKYLHVDSCTTSAFPGQELLNMLNMLNAHLRDVRCSWRTLCPSTLAAPCCQLRELSAGDEALTDSHRGASSPWAAAVRRRTPSPPAALGKTTTAAAPAPVWTGRR